MSTAARTKRGRNPEGRMSLGSHLRELKNRFFWVAAGIAAGAIAGWFLEPFVWDAISLPVHEIAKSQNASINWPNVTAAFDLKLQLSVYIGIIASSPLWLYEIFAFLTPGLTRKEKGYTFGFFFTAVPLFLAGCAAGWWVVPHIVGVLTSFVPSGETTLLVASDYFNFVLKLIIVIGIAFVLPVFVVLLNFMRVISAKAIIKAWRWAILTIMVFTAIATPSADVISMFLLALPLVVLYLLSWLIATLHDRRLAKRELDIEAELAS
ncbi:twin-arginine translocase subunit TatC [Humibacter albus]|uniref:twin-arginine translocase subunit TatC n=1 Tax=Humibacter albus TaxID=427754 RepID=UPI0004288D4B|nr:twin-arginine translocase subunit TatC [Humibacter albus]